MRTGVLLMLFLTVLLAAVIADDSSPTIAEIQGELHRSHLHRQDVERVHGIVTAVEAGGGFYMESARDDGNPATSEGIHVVGYRLPSLAAGDEVLVSGRVEEVFPGGPSSGNLPITTIRRASVEVVSRDNELPPPAVIGIGGISAPDRRIAEYTGGLVYDSEFDPTVNALDFYESFESMRVRINDAVSVGTAHSAYGEIWVLPDDGEGASVRTPRGGIVVREGDFNPERLLIDYLETPPIFTQDPVVLPVVGDRFTGPIEGIVSYSYGNYKVRPTGQLPSPSRRNLAREVAKPPAGPDTLSVAAFNVYNLSAGDGPAKFADLAETIVTGLAAPDILVLPEVQDEDDSPRSPVVTSQGTARRLIDAIRAASGPPDYRYTDIAPEPNQDGGAPGGNIRVGFLYRSDRLTLVERPGGDATTAARVIRVSGEVGVSPSPGRIEPGNRAFSSSRKPLVAEFVFNGTHLFVIGVHFNSKGGDGYLFGQVQPPTFNSGVQRTAQAQVVRRFVEEILAADPEAHVIVAGDLNDFTFAGPLAELKGDPPVLRNLAEELLPEREIYSYIYEGNSQVLDHILVSAALRENPQVELRYVHRYSEYLYENRHSDHDPVLARFRFR